MAANIKKATTEETVELVLSGRKTQYIHGMGILRHGKPFNASLDHAKRLLAAKNRATGEPLFMRAEDYKAQRELEAKATSGDLSVEPVSLGMSAEGGNTSSGVEIEEV